MMDVDRFMPRLEAALTPARLRHSLGVMQVMGDLAEVYGLNAEQAMTAGLLHDAAKDFTPEEQDRAFREAGIEIQNPVEMDYNAFLHGPVGAFVVEKTYGVTDKLVLNAINTHTAMDGDDFHHPLSWCLRFSDLLEPNRNFLDVPRLRRGLPRVREAAFSGRLTEAALLQYGLLSQWFTEVGYPVHPNMCRIVSELYQRLELDASFLE